MRSSVLRTSCIAAVAAVVLAISGPAFSAVVINEIHYNPPGDDNTVRLEFVELHNTGPGPADISLWQLDIGGGLTIPIDPGTTIPAGGYFVFAEQISTLQAATGYTAQVEFIGYGVGLSNGGELVRLLGPAPTNAVIDGVDYNDDPPWPADPDGAGPTLELINPLLDNNLASSWRPSVGANGTPGAQNSTFTSAPVVSSESPTRLTAVMTLPSVQVTFSASVTGVVSGDLTVAGSQATSVSCPSCVGGAGAGPYIFTGFTAPPAGSVTVALASGAIQSGGIPFAGASWTISVGVKVVLNEIHYHPANPNDDAEFVELYNAGPGLVNLSGWTVSDGLTMDFQPGTTLPSGGYLVIALNPSLLQSVTGYAGALAWTTGRLANEGERLALSDASGNEIDVVRFDDRGSWTNVPDGDGPTLELVNPNLANEYGAAWTSSTGANGTPGAQNSAYQYPVAPIVAETIHSPVIPAPSQAVTVTALVLDDENPNPTVTLYYRQDFDPTIAYASTQMFDDGLHGDGTAGDRVYGGTMPGLADGARMDFTIRADDGVAVGAGPRGHNTLNAGQYPAQTYLLKFASAAPLTDFPHYHLLTTQRTNTLQANHDKTYYDASFIHCRTTGGCEVWYNVRERYRGQSSLGMHPHSFRIDFPDERPLTSEMGYEVTRLLVMAQSTAKQYLGYQFFREAFGGQLLGPRAQFVRLNTNPLSHGGTQDYVYINVERQDEDFLESQNGDILPTRFPDMCSLSLVQCESDADCPPTETCRERDHGDLYRGVHPGADFQYLGPTAANGYRTATYEKETNEELDDWSQLIQLCYILDPDTTPNASFESAVKAYVDEDEWAKWFAVHMLLVNQEGGIYRDTGDDFYVYFEPATSPLGRNTKMLVWDQDSVFGGFASSFNQETIWRTNVQTTQRFVRHNAFAGRFVGGICSLLNNHFTRAVMDPKIDALPNAVADAGYKTALKNWISQRIAYVNGEITRQSTITGVPTSPYTSANPVIALSGQLNQCGTVQVRLNGIPVTNFSVLNHTWSASHTLIPGPNEIVLQTLDENGVEMDRATASVLYDPPITAQSNLRLTMPAFMLNDRTLTLKAEILDSIGRIDWHGCFGTLGTVTMTRVSDSASIPITVTVFDTHLSVPADSIRFYHGVGSVSFFLDAGAAVPAGDYRVTVTVGTLSATKVVSVLNSPPMRLLSGNLTGANLTWGPNEVIRITGNTAVPSGSTLTINPGTLVMVNTTGGTGDGTRIDVYGNISAIGTQANPIYFFSERGQAAMRLTVTDPPGLSNPDAWRGILHNSGGQTSTYKWVFITGAGNGPIVGHPRPHVLGLYSNHSILFEDSMMLDGSGMGFGGQGTGNYTVRRGLISRMGIGAEFNGNGHVLRLEDTWMTGIGRGPTSPLRFDGDIIHIDGSASDQLLTRSVFVDGGDDGIDHSGSSFRLQNSIIHDINDKAISMTGGLAEIRNTLIFSSGTGVRGTARVYNSTITPGSPIATPQIVQESIIWSSSIGTCSADVDYTIVGNPADLGCGTGNRSVNPQFENTGQCDYDPLAGSPALTAGPSGGRIGWLGFPTADSCVLDTDCDDHNACSVDTCLLGVCDFRPIAGCRPCVTNADCNDSDACTNDLCGTQGTCQSSTPVSCDDGNVCTADSCDTQLGCQHTSGSCDDGNACTDDACSPATGCSHTNNTASCSDGNLCTLNDSCSAGACVGTPRVCPGGQACQQETGNCVAGPFTLTFQDGVGGYAGTQDTYLDEDTTNHGVAQGALDNWGWDTENVAPYAEHGLIRFDNVFGAGAGQIPLGSTIQSATLSLVVFNPGATTAGTVNESAIDWSEAATTWDNFGPAAGVSADDYRATPSYAAPIPIGTGSVTVTSSVQAWANGTRTNYGWIFRPANFDGVRVRSAEYATVAERPLLSITYVPPSSACTTDPDCNDGNLCNGAEICVTGACAPGTAPNCDDANLCTTDSCVPATGCAHVNNNTPCNDGSACTVSDACSGGACQPGTPLTCTDNNVCTNDTCNPASGCVYTNNTGPCDDDNECTSGDACSGGACSGTPATGPCDDGSLCTTGDTCGGGGCAGTPVTCPGGYICNPSTGNCELSTEPPLPIGQGATWRYFKGSAAPPSNWTAIAFDDSGWLQGASGFGYGSDCAATRGTTLGDMQNSYVSIYTRRKFSVLTPASVVALTLTVDYDDAFVAYLNGVEVARRNVTGTPPSNTQLATADHECSTCNSTCNAAEAINISAFIPQLVTGTNVLTIQAHNLTSNSTDFTLLATLAATTTQCTTNGECDNNDVCDGAETCVGGACLPGSVLNCDDANACTTDSCLPVGGCQHANNTLACSDGNACTTNDACSNGACVGGPAPNCDDTNICTTDSCNSGSGCVHAPNALSCSDGQYCNGIEVCGGGICQPGTPVACDDGIACTADSCNEGTDSCEHAPCAMTASAEGSRYLVVTPPAGLASVALKVSSAGITCLPQYVDAVGRLTASPVFRSSAQWGTVRVGDREILPSTAYTVAAEVVAGTPVGSAGATTWGWGNANTLEDVNIFDIICVMDGYQNIFTQCSLHSDDQKSGIPDGLIDLDDILATLDAFSGAAYPDPNPCTALTSGTATGGTGRATGTAAEALDGAFVRLVASASTIRPGETVRVDVFGEGLLNLRGYQIALQASGGTVGTLALREAGVTATRDNYVFLGRTAYTVADPSRTRLANALSEGGVQAGGEVYLGSFTFRASDDARGTFRVAFRPDETLLRDAASRALEAPLGTAVEIQVKPSRRKTPPRTTVTATEGLTGSGGLK